MKTIPFLSLEAQHAAVEQELQQAMARVLKSNWFILGKELTNFEEAFAAYCGTKFSVGVANGLDALILSLRAVGVGPGDEVIVPAHTYIATWLAVTAVGAWPVPVEPNIETCNIDVRKIEASISKKTKAIIPVHLYGQACEMTEIMRIAEKHKLFVVEDNAQAQGAMWENRKTGSFGHCNATSFYPGKNLGALGDAGAITTNIEEHRNKVLSLRNYGSQVKYYHDDIGVNSRLDELQAALLSVKLQRLDQWTEERRAIAAHYQQQLKGIGDLILPAVAKGSTHVYHLYVIRTRRRDALQKYLSDQSIQTLVHYPLPPHLQKAYATLNFKNGDFPLTEELSNTCLSLPLWPGMTADMIFTVSAAIKKFYA